MAFKMIELTLAKARALHLAAQGLLVPPVKRATPAALLACISRMGLLQIDTIHVVARSPYLTLFSRLGHYQSHWLDDALAQGKVFETWAHEACFAPTSNLLQHRHYNSAQRNHWGLSSAQRAREEYRSQLDALLVHIRDNGAVKSSDFERKDDRTSAWWGWKEEKIWLEALFASGELMVARREKFQRVYDLAERVAPQVAAMSSSDMSLDGVRQHFVEKSIAALGVTQARWINDYFRMKPRLKDADLDHLVDQGTVLRVAVEGWNAPGYVHASQSALLKKAAAGKLQATHTALLSPFDPVVWDRERASKLFDFDYRLECYTPEAKRLYGYFVLPILCHGALIGRLDAKAHRVQGVFEVKALFAQAGSCWSDAQVRAVADALIACAAWHKTPLVRLNDTQPKGLAARLRRDLQNPGSPSFDVKKVVC
jgi:uncharacterized protein YcaQ